MFTQSDLDSSTSTIALSFAHIARQHQIACDIDRHGGDITEAVRILRQLEALHEEHQNYRKIVKEALSRKS